MKVFLEEYGLALFLMICIIFLIVIASPVSEIVKNAITNVVNSFSTTTQNGFDAIEMPTFAAA